MKSTTRSYLILISSMLVFGTVGIFRRYIPLSSALIAFCRGIGGALVLVLICAVTRHPLKNNIGRRNLLLLIASGCLIGFNWLFLFEAYNYTSVATATLCYYMAPTIVILLSPIFFKERLGAKKLLCAAAALLGMAFVAGVLDEGGIRLSGLKGIFYGLAAACLYASVVILNKAVKAEDAYEMTVIQLLSASLVMLPYLLATENFASVALDLTGAVMLLIMCVVHTGISYAMYFGSIKKLKAQSVAVLSYIDPVSALFLSALILKERLTLSGVVGAVLIIGSAFISEWEPKRKASVDGQP